MLWTENWAKKDEGALLVYVAAPSSQAQSEDTPGAQVGITHIIPAEANGLFEAYGRIHELPWAAGKTRPAAD